MTEIIANSFFEGSEFEDFTGELIEEFHSDLFVDTWSHTNIEELNKSLEMALGDTNRFEVESPDSGIDTNPFDFDIDGCNALLGVNDPLLNNFNDKISDVEENMHEEVISLDLPVITNEIIEETTEPTSMESDNAENEENSPSNIPKNHPVDVYMSECFLPSSFYVQKV